MKHLFFLLAFCSVFSVFGQRNPDLDDMKVKRQEVKQVVLDFFEAFHEADTTRLGTLMHKAMRMQTIYKGKDGKNVLQEGDTAKFLSAIASKPKEQRWNEQLLLFRIEFEEQMAHVWTPYEFYVNDRFSHCGVNSFQLMKENDNWKIIYIIDTRRKEGCKN